MISSMMTRRRLAPAAAAALFLAAAPHALAQGSAGSYPTRPIHIVVGFSAGGGNDIIARVVGEKLAQEIGQSVVVDNKPGAGGIIAADFVKNAAPDGYTLILAPSSTMAINPAVYSKLSYDPLKDFRSISLLAYFPLMMVVDAKSPFKSVKDVVAFAKANPAKANYSGASVTFQLPMELVKLKTGMPMEFVRYKSSTESIDAVMHEGVTTTIVDPGPATAPLKDGKIRVLAVTSPKRDPALPDVPTLAEAGVPDVDVEIWAGLFAPSATPDAIVEKLSAAIAKVMQTPEIAARFKTLGMQASASTPAALRQRVEREIPQWTDVAKRANVHLTQ